MSFRVIGNPDVIRPDGFDKVKGQAVFASDISLPGMLWAAVKKAPYAHARVKHVDVSRARAAGYTVITRDDIPTGLRIARMKVITGEGDNVNYAGEVVAAVAAPTEDQAEDALDLIDVEYEPLPFTLSILDALRPDAPKLDPNGNVLGAIAGVEAEGTAFSTQTRIVRGDINAGFAQADVIVEDQLATPTISHLNMEPRATVAQWVNGKLTMWISTQGNHSTQRGIAAAFNLPSNMMRVMGGGTNVAGMTQGDKGAMKQEDVIAAALALKAGVPVKYFLTRMDNQLNSTKRYPVLGYVKIGAKKSTGLLTAIHARYLTNTGAYGTSGPSGSLGDIQDAYICPNGLFEGIAVMTNQYNIAGALRDVGETQGHFIMEGPMDQVAEKLGMDPWEFRLLNMQKNGLATPPGSQDTGQPWTGWGQPDTHNYAAQLFGWKQRWKGWDNYKNQKGPIKTGIGVAIMAMNKGAMSNPMSADITINPDGTIQTYNGISEHGSGMKSVIAVVEAEVLGVKAKDIQITSMGDTDLTRDSGGQGGSRAARSAGEGATQAAIDAKAKLLAAGATYINAQFKMNVKASDLDTLNRVIFLKSDKTVSATWQDVLKGTSGIKGVGNYTAPTGFGNRVDQTAIAEVQVDTETGNIKVLNYVASFGIGRVLWAKGIDGQFVGGFSGTGGGAALYENEMRDPITGKYLNPNLHDYGPMTWLDTPDPEKLQVKWNEYVDRFGTWGAKGVGEPSVGIVAAAIANAFYNATGARLRTMPFRPDTVLAALKNAGRAANITVPPLTPTNVNVPGEGMGV